MAQSTFSLSPGKRILFLTKDADLIRRQLSGSLSLQMKDLRVEDLLDDINTDIITPAWVCFDFDPRAIAQNAYAGMISGGKPVFGPGALAAGNFEVIVSGQRKGVGSSRETAVQAEVYCGSQLAIASSFSPIHARNNINVGQLMGDHALLARLEQGETLALDEFTKDYDSITELIVRCRGLFSFCEQHAAKTVRLPTLETQSRPMTICEKILANHLVPGQGNYVKPGDSALVTVDGGYSHEFTSAQVHTFLTARYGAQYQIANREKFAVFEDHLIYADDVPRLAQYQGKIQLLREIQADFQAHTGMRDYTAHQGAAPGICHQVAREKIIEPGDFVLATDSHTCMGGASNTLAWGVGATEYAALLHWGFAPVSVPETIRFELTGTLRPGVTAKDLMLHILCTYAKREETLDRVMEFGGSGLFSLAPDERATVANMASECSARSAVMECDDEMLKWIVDHRPDADIDTLSKRMVAPDPGAEYAGGVHTIDLTTIPAMVATPGDNEKGIPSDPKNGVSIDAVGVVPIDIAYGGSCTAGKRSDIDMYAAVMLEAEQAGRHVSDQVQFFLQFGSADVARYAGARGYLEMFARTGVQVIDPGCGACIGCGPGVSERADQVTISAINRNYKGRSGPGLVYLGSPLTVAASAVIGRIVSYQKGMFG